MVSENRPAEARKPGRAHSGSRITGYLLTWAALAACALGYLTVAAARPDLLAIVLPVADRGYDGAGSLPNGSDVRDEMTTMRKWVNELQHEMAAAKSAIEAQTTESRVLAQRITAAEARLPGLRDIRTGSGNEPVPPPAQSANASSSAPATEPDRLASAPPATAPEPPPAPVASTAFEKTIVAAIAEPPEAARSAPAPVAIAPPSPPPPAPQKSASRSAPSVKILNPVPSAQITTGSVVRPSPPPAPTPKFGAAKVTPPPPPAPVRGIEIGNAESLDGLRSQWSQLTSRNGAVLSQLAPRYLIAADGSQSPFKLMAGPFKTTNEAVRACRALRARGVACKVGRYIGNAF
jgi:hypothetical protein